MYVCVGICRGFHGGSGCVSVGVCEVCVLGVAMYDCVWCMSTCVCVVCEHVCVCMCVWRESKKLKNRCECCPALLDLTNKQL